MLALRSLSLNKNRLEEVQVQLLGLAASSHVSLMRPWSVLQGLGALKKLDCLDLRRNAISMHAGFASIAGTTSLRTLKLSGNPVEQCPCYRFTWYVRCP